ncbi:NADP-dependent oxidoreductase [Actinopolymorpha pittospori]|uniref:NADPH:quinone reductase-like Zn-dependent oxidoreductase n=1 Tax=Actinopolymorpha pittospori TaxID=648752 RepID=A0A927RMT8_9ACTN|nr:NADP-dependent oxidoreductase [Actinopolymorpha pittospori]MBE1609303.1 NADPH:quinone reductase-like Zn-dependent oxidoreductase [Actinopolymorpha pittospori]
MADTYRAVVFSEYGDPDVLRIVERDAPRPGPGEVRIAVRAAGVNPIDWKVRSGVMPLVPAGGFPSVPGVDVAGVVEEVGEGVTEYAVGDEVLGAASSGSYAEVAVAPVEKITAKPSEVSWEVAGGLSVAATTTYRVFALLDLTPGETVLIDGAAGGVGTVAVQVARHRGLTVIGTASERNHDYLRSLGAIPVTYGDGLADRVRAVAPQGVDAAVDASGRGSLATLVDLTGGPERVVTIADGAAADLGVRFTFGGPDEVPGSLADAVALVATGKLILPIARTYSLAEAASAHWDSEAGHVQGKLVLLTS